MEEIVSSLPFNAFETVEPSGFAGGILMLWNEALHSFHTITKEDRALHGVIQVQNSPSFYISIIYANTTYKGRLEVWNNLKITSQLVSIPWLVLGDFNEVTHAHEKIGGNRPKDYKMFKYMETMNAYNLYDLGYIGSKFTWFNKRKSQPIFERLDRCWACPNWSLNFPDAVVNNLPRLSSDHNPVLLTLKAQMIDRREFFLKFESNWLQDLLFDPWVRENWASYSNNLTNNLKNLSQDIQTWNNNKGDVFKKKKNL